MEKLSRGLLALVVAALLGFGVLLAAANTPVELGKVRWGRNHSDAVTASQKSGKPLLVLFQEVPG